MNLGDTIRTGVKWVLGGRIGNQIIQFLFGLVLARLLLPADFGRLVTIQVFTGLLGCIVGGGMGQALVQAKDVEERDWDVVFTMQFAAGAAIYLALFIVAPFIARWFSEPIYEPLLRVSAISFVIRPLANISNSRLQRGMRFRALATTAFLSILNTGLISITLAAIGLGVWSLVFSGLAGSVINVVILIAITRWQPRLSLNTDVARKYAGYGFTVSASDIVWYLNQQATNFLVSRLLGPAAVGLYSKAVSLYSMPGEVLSGSAYQLVFRALASVQDNLDRSRYLYYRTLQLVLVYTLPFYVGLLWVAKPLITVLYGEKWLAAAEPLQILALGGLLYCIQNQSGAVAAAQGKLAYELRIHATSLFISAVALFLATRFGIVGAAWVTLGVSCYVTFRLARLAQVVLKGSAVQLWRAVRPALLLNAGLAVALFFADEFLLKPYLKTVPWGQVWPAAYAKAKQWSQSHGAWDYANGEDCFMVQVEMEIVLAKTWHFNKAGLGPHGVPH